MAFKEIVHVISGAEKNQLKQKCIDLVKIRIVGFSFQCGPFSGG